MLSFLRQIPWQPSLRVVSQANYSLLPSGPIASLLHYHAKHARFFHPSPSSSMTLNQSMRRKKPPKVKLSSAPLLNGAPQRKGVISQLLIGKPKKPNSAKRKLARVKLSTGKTVKAYIPGEGHNLQEHSVVLVRGGRTQDLPGLRHVTTQPSCVGPRSDVSCQI